MKNSMGIELKVGLFVASGLVLFAASILLLGGNRFFLTSSYTLRAQFDHVQGLSSGSVVSLAGVPVGNVTKMEFQEDSNKIVLDFRIDRAAASKITKGSTASVKTQGALGDKFIYITPGPRGEIALEANEFIEVNSQTDFLESLSEKSGDFSAVVDIIQELKALMHNMNDKQRSVRLMDNLVNSSKSFDQFSREATHLVQDIRSSAKGQNQIQQTLDHLNSILEKVDNGHGTLGALVNDPSVYDRLLNLLGQPNKKKYLKPLIRESIQSQN